MKSRAIFLQWCTIFFFMFFTAVYCDDEENYEKNSTHGCGSIFEKKTGSIENNTLLPDTICSYVVKPASNGTVTHIFVKKLLLDDKDNVTISLLDEDDVIISEFDAKNKTFLFPILHGQSDAVILIPINGVKNFNITIQMSSVKDIVRHFDLYYDSSNPSCSFPMAKGAPLTVQQPIYQDENATGECSLTYNLIQNIVRSFSFESFNLTGPSSISAKGIQSPVSQLTGQTLPPDLFATGTAEFVIKSTNKDRFVLRQDYLNAACSKYRELTDAEVISPPVAPKLDNGSLNHECRWFFENKDNQAIGFTLNSMTLNSAYDILAITDGPRFYSTPLYQITSSTVAQALKNNVATSGKSIIISFRPSSDLSTFNARVFVAGKGGYFQNNGTIAASGTTKENTTWLLEVADNETVVLNFDTSAFKEPSVLDIYDGFSAQSKHIASLQGNVWYPVLSSTSKMMIVARNFGQGTFGAHFKGSATGCMHMSQGSSDSYILSGNCNSSCSWIIPPIKSDVNDLILDLQYISLDVNDVIEVLHLDKDKSLIAKITPNISHAPQITLQANVGAYVNITRGLCVAKTTEIILVGQVNYLPKCSGKVTLTINTPTHLTSPGFPNTYPVLADCKWAVTTSLPKPLIHIVFNKLQLAPGHCLTLTENKTQPIQYNSTHNTVLPEDVFLSTDTMIQFNSNNCGSAKVSSLISDQGFDLTVTSADCGGILQSKKADAPVSVVNKTICIWKINVPAKTGEDVNIVTFTVQKKDKIGNFELDIYDGASLRDKKIVNTSDSTFWSRTNTLIVIYKKLDVSKPSTEVTISYDTKSCNKSMQCDNGICMHPDWRCNHENDCGDYSDETNCQPVPIQPTPAPAGVSSVTLAVGLILMFGLGVLLAIFVPVVITKLRSGQYRQFRDVSVIE